MHRTLASLAAALIACGNSTLAVPDASPQAPAPDSVAHDELALAPAPADWLLLFDRTTTWATRFDRFEGLKDAIASFLAERGAAFALAATSFPRYAGDALDCQTTGYDDAELGWSSPPATIAQTIVDEWSYVGTSTLGPALAGAGVITKDRRIALPGHSTSIVLLTDAAPNEDEECESSAWDVVAETAAQLHDGGRGAQVHVVSVMGTAVSPDHMAKLNAIARAGAGYAAFVNGSRTDVATSARQVLADLDARAMTCTRNVPAGTVPEAIRISSPDGHVVDAHRVSDSTQCQGYAFYLDDPIAPTTLTLCSGPAGLGGFCEMTFVRAAAAGQPTISMITTAQ